MEDERKVEVTDEANAIGDGSSYPEGTEWNESPGVPESETFEAVEEWDGGEDVETMKGEAVLDDVQEELDALPDWTGRYAEQKKVDFIIDMDYVEFSMNEAGYECPECSASLETDAGSCPHCGLHFEEEKDGVEFTVDVVSVDMGPADADDGTIIDFDLGGDDRGAGDGEGGARGGPAGGRYDADESEYDFEIIEDRYE